MEHKLVRVQINHVIFITTAMEACYEYSEEEENGGFEF